MLRAGPRAMMTGRHAACWPVPQSMNAGVVPLRGQAVRSCFARRRRRRRPRSAAWRPRMPACSASCTTPPPAWQPRRLWRPCGARPRPRAPRPARCARLTAARAAPRRPQRPTPCRRATRGRCSASRAGPGSRARRSAAALTAAAWRPLPAPARAGCVLRLPRRRLRCQLSVACPATGLLHKMPLPCTRPRPLNA